MGGIERGEATGARLAPVHQQRHVLYVESVKSMLQPAGLAVPQPHSAKSGWLQNWSISQIKRETGMGRFFIALPSHAIANSEAAK
jgi:hypothetical protein